MTTTVELGRVDFPRADLTIGDASYTRAHFWGDGQTFHAETREGESIGSITVTVNAEGFHSVERLDAKRHLLTGQDGSTWLVERGGCGCGGG